MELDVSHVRDEHELEQSQPINTNKPNIFDNVSPYSLPQKDRQTDIFDNMTLLITDFIVAQIDAFFNCIG